MRTPAAVLLAAGLLLLPGAPVAGAAVTASLSGGVLTITGDALPNQIIVSDAGANLSIDGATAAGSGCAGTGPVTCSDAGTTTIVATLGDDLDVWDSNGIDKATTVDLGNGIPIAGLYQRARTGNAADTIIGGPHEESDIVTGGGNDTIRLLGGDDARFSFIFTGGPGSVLAGPGEDVIEMGDGNDGGTGNDNFIDGGPGNDTYDLGAGNDRNVVDDFGNTGDSGNDTLLGGPGEDGTTGPFWGLGAGNDSFDGGPGNDFAPFGGDGVDSLRGGADNDTMSTSLDGFSETVEGGPGDDTIAIEYAGPGIGDPGSSDTISGGSGRDTVSGVLSPTFAVPSILSTDGVANDGFGDAPRTVNIAGDVEILIGAAGDDQLLGADVRGNKGADLLTATAASSRLDGGEGGDTLTGGGSDDVLIGGLGDDALAGGGGNDSLVGGGGADAIGGGDGRDTGDWSTALAPVTLTPGAAGGSGENGEGDSLGADVENLIGSPFNDRITGAPGESLLSGGAGDDTFTATDGAPDILVCGAGDDSGSADAVDALELSGPERCERVTQPAAVVPTPTPGAAPGGIVLGPLPTVALVGKVDSKGRAQVRITCPAAATATCRGDVRFVAKNGEPTSRKTAFSAAAGKRATARVTLGTALRRSLRRARSKRLSARLLAEVEGPSSTFRRVTKAVTLRR